MIQVTVGNAQNRNVTIVSEDTTVQQVLSDAGQDWVRFTPFLSGRPLNQTEVGMTFRNLGVTGSCTLLCVHKPDNA